jgi:hypothetical protein
MDLPSGEYDTITATGVSERLDDDGDFRREVNRLFKANGVLVLLTSSFPYLWTMNDEANHHKRRYYLRALERQINARGFETIRFSHLNCFLFPILASMLLVHRLIYGLHPKHCQRLLPIPPRPINRILTRVLEVEARLMRWMRLPWGIWMIGAFREEA